MRVGVRVRERDRVCECKQDHVCVCVRESACVSVSECVRLCASACTRMSVVRMRLHVNVRCMQMSVFLYVRMRMCVYANVCM